MKTLGLRYLGDTILRKKAAPVESFDQELRDLAHAMIETMRIEEGIGLAAPQIGESIRLLVIEGSVIGEHEEPRVYVNPVIEKFSRSKDVYEEGCLSIPDIRCDVERPLELTVRYQNLNGDAMEEEADELLARVLQHEVDHLDGILFIDRISTARRALLRKKLRDIEKKYA
ncbi:MAG: peptide deformylase [Gemmatimonadetes bacterium]|nr:peptide deformylase [Gemmatimonadota bacterium]